ncbi:MAG TPA: F0F1 ATP synthase subunit A [Terriglobales bacterium]|nr:F0F1 ATP synthase subunit A [Terriglobales bacterium]
MPEQLPFTALLNRAFAGPVTAALNALHLYPKYPAAPISNPVAMQILVVLLLVVAFMLLRLRLSVDHPGGMQHMAESTHEFFSGMGRELIGHDYERFLPYITALGIYILACCLIGLVPAFESPTATPAVPLGCAIATFVYYNFHGVKHHGAGYAKQFMGPVLFLAPLVFLIEVVSHLARVLSLTVRLFANMFAGEMVTLAFFSLIPLGVPVIFMGLHIGVALIQTYIFVLLTCVYLGAAVSHEH